LNWASSGTPALARLCGGRGLIFRQIQAISDGKAGAFVGHRQRNGDLTIVLFAELPAILVGDADGMKTFFRKSVSSTIHARIGSLFVIADKTSSRAPAWPSQKPETEVGDMAVPPLRESEEQQYLTLQLVPAFLWWTDPTWESDQVT
jgi:hypothetical protein